MCVCVCVCARSVMSNSFTTPWVIAHQAPLSMGFSRQECWSVLPFPPPGGLPDRDGACVSCTSCIGRQTPYCWASATASNLYFGWLWTAMLPISASHAALWTLLLSSDLSSRHSPKTNEDLSSCLCSGQTYLHHWSMANTALISWHFDPLVISPVTKIGKHGKQYSSLSTNLFLNLSFSLIH